MEVKHDANYYGKCMIGGILSCGLTHTAVVPIDIVKCRSQVDPAKYPGLVSGIKIVKAEQGMQGLKIGWLPTLIGYSMQGFGKFGFYEIFKDVYAGIVGPENAKKYQAVGWLVASACAEVIADVLLCPMEAVKVRMQTSPPGTFPTSLSAAVDQIKAAEGTSGFYKGLSPLWGRQVPYTMVKFASFEAIVRWFYSNVFTAGRENYSSGFQLSVTFISGYLAGVLCALVSQPADTIVSKLNQKKTSGSTTDAIKEIVAEVGVGGLYRGLGARIIMIGTLTGLQWWIYDGFKTIAGLKPTSKK